MQRCSFKRTTPIICCADGAPVEVAPRAEDDYCDRPILDEATRELCATLDQQGQRRSTTKGKKQLDVGKIAQRECLKLLANKPRSLTFNILSGEMVNPGDYPHMVRKRFLIYCFCVFTNLTYFLFRQDLVSNQQILIILMNFDVEQL